LELKVAFCLGRAVLHHPGFLPESCRPLLPQL
jgi:hypothetical protein